MSSYTALTEDFQKEYPYLSKDDIIRLFKRAEGLYLDLAFPFDHSVDSVASIVCSRPRALNWIRDCMIELLERSGCSSAVGYSENGLSFSFDGATVSDRLLSRIKPVVGVVR